MKLLLLKLYSFIRLHLVLFAKHIITGISLILKPSSNKFSSIYFGMLKLEPQIDNFCGVYLPYLEQYTRATYNRDSLYRLSLFFLEA